MNRLDNALCRILSDSMTDILPKAGQIGVCTPNDVGDVSLGLYLYNIRPCGEIDLPPVVRKGYGVQESPPQFLSLYYLFTAYSKVDAPYQSTEDHKILFRAMQVMNSLPVLTERELGYCPSAYINKLQVKMVDILPEEMINIWTARSTPYRLSVAYRIAPVELQSLNAKMIPRIEQTDFTGIQK